MTSAKVQDVQEDTSICEPHVEEAEAYESSYTEAEVCVLLIAPTCFTLFL